MVTSAHWPPDRFYWAVLDAPGLRLRSPGLLPPGLEAMLAEEVPSPMDDLHAVCAGAGDGRVIVCAARREHIAGLDATTVRLTPESLPGCIGSTSGIEPRSFNLLIGGFEPSPVRRARIRRHALAASFSLLLCTVAAAGLFRRAHHWTSVGGRSRTASAAILDRAALGDATPRTLLAETARLRRLAEASSRIHAPTDITPMLATLLKSWPTQVPSRPLSISVSAAGAAVSVNLDDDPAGFLAALRPPEGWTMDEPRLSRSGAITRIGLQLHAPTTPGAGQ